VAFEFPLASTKVVPEPEYAEFTSYWRTSPVFSSARVALLPVRVADVIVGAPGTVRGVEVIALDGALEPWAFIAATVKE
jgi:hypothetical protein